MRVIAFTAYYEPEIAASMYLATNLYEGMANNGWDVNIFTPMPTRGIDDNTKKEYSKIKLESKCGGNLRINRFSMMNEGNNSLQRAARYFLVSLVYIWKGLRTQEDVIFVQSTPPTQGAVAAVLKRIKKIPLIYNLQDVFPDSLVNAGMTKHGSFIWKIGALVERFTYRNADKIIVISEDIKSNIIAKGVPKEKVEVVYNWVEANEVKPIPKEENVLYKRYDLDPSIFYVVYAGNLGYAQNIEVIIKAAEILKGDEGIQFLIFGKGAQEENYMQMTEESSLKNIRFLPMQSYSDVSQVYSLGDVSVVSCKEGFGGSAMPSKTWNIMSCGTAVLASFDVGTDLQRIIEDNKVGIFSKAGDSKELAKSIEKCFVDRALCKEMGQKGRDFILKNLTREICVSKYLEIIEKRMAIRDA